MQNGKWKFKKRSYDGEIELKFRRSRHYCQRNYWCYYEYLPYYVNYMQSLNQMHLPN